MPQQPAERLQKVLARLGLASRREAEEWIRAGRVTVNGRPATLGVRVRPTDQLRLDGRPIRRRETGAPHVYVGHRSPGESLRPDTGHGGEAVSAGARPRAQAVADRAAFVERLPRRESRRLIAVSPMPRVDGGLELLTSDGELAARLQRSVRRLECEFSVRVRGELGPDQLEGIRSGMLDRGEPLAVASLEASGGEGANRWYTLVARGASGKDVRQLFERQGVLVSRVLRTRLGPLALDRRLSRGQYRRLTEAETQTLLDVAAPPRPAARRPSRPGSRSFRR